MRSIEARILIPFLIIIIVSLAVLGFTSYYGSYKIFKSLIYKLPDYNENLYTGIITSKLLELQKYTILVAIIAIIAASQLTFFFTYSIVRPIKKLSIACERVAKGDFDVKVEYKSKDEIGTLKDAFNTMVSKIKEYVENLEKINRLTLVGEMSASLAHEIRNPLQGIKSCLQVIESDIKDKNDLLGELFSLVYLEINRIDKIISDLLSYARPSDPHFECISLEKIFKELLPFIDSLTKRKRLKFKMDIEKGIKIYVDASHFKQIVINIISNSLKACRENDSIFIKAQKKDDEVIIEIMDTGIGISKENLSKIFNPFFTTFNEGTGLGLCVVQTLVNQNKGKIWIKSEENRGTEVYISFPCAESHILSEI